MLAANTFTSVIGNNAMTDTYWVVRLEALSFETKEEADAFRNKMEDAVTAMPDSETLTFFTSVTEKSDQ